MYFFKHPFLFLSLILLSACTQEQERTSKQIIIPEKITMLFVTQPSCPSCDKLEESIGLEKPQKLIKSYFNIKKVYLGEPLPYGLVEPKGTPTVYFLGANDDILIEPIIGEKSEEKLLHYLENALYAFKHLYGIDLIVKKNTMKNRDNNETNTTF